VQTPAKYSGTACPAHHVQRNCNTFACPTFQYAYSRWGDCSSPCGASGTKRRLYKCRRSDGKTVSNSLCTNLNPETTTSCNGGVLCAAYRWTATPFGACSKSCTGADGVAGKVTRTFVCTDTASAATESDATKCGAQGLPTERTCNTRKCITYGWSISLWGACSKSCGGGMLTRSVSCMASDSSVATVAQCALAKPAANTACNTKPCNPCAGETCSGHGTCSSGACTCSGGFQGLRCATPASCLGSLDRTDACCLGPLMPDATCCTGASAKIDSNGACCTSGVLDVCGLCDGTATAIDALGACCSGSIGEDGLCCASSNFDTCGVCDGDDSSCNVAVDMVLAPPSGETADTVLASSTKLSTFKNNFKQGLASALSVPDATISVTGVVKKSGRRLAASRPSTDQRRRLAASLTASFTLDQAKVTAAAAPVSALKVLEKLSTAVSGGSGVFAKATIQDVAPAAVCGNGACEAGERCETASSSASTCCRGDCPYLVLQCPSPSWQNGGACSKHGKCVASSGACMCFAEQGYTGKACDECSSGYLMDAVAHTCLRQVSAADKANANAPGPSPAAPAAPSKSTDTSFADALKCVMTKKQPSDCNLTRGHTAGLVAILLLVVVAATCVIKTACRRCKRSSPSKQVPPPPIPYSENDLAKRLAGGVTAPNPSATQVPLFRVNNGQATETTGTAQTPAEDAVAPIAVRALV